MSWTSFFEHKANFCMLGCVTDWSSELIFLGKEKESMLNVTLHTSAWAGWENSTNSEHLISEHSWDKNKLDRGNRQKEVIAS